MAKQCVHGVLDASKYSSPVPFIGLYIAAATLLCLIFMIYDIFAAICSRRRWLPCRLFSLNSMTLTLLSVVAKLPIDLTSPMPSAQDQLSKLTSTTVICISMGFFMPSIGINKDSDCLDNMIALTIFVLTIIANVSMQMYTKVIVLFTTEHIIIMGCMVGMLIMLWFLAEAIKHQKNVFIDSQKDLIRKGKESMLQRLKVCYLHGFNSNPQYVPCKDPHSATIGFLCLLSLVVTIQATVRSLFANEMKLCKGVSDYSYSVWMIVVSQIATIIIGCCATSFRWLTMVTQMQGNQYTKLKQKEKTYINPILGIVARHIWKDICEIVLWVGDLLLIMIVLVPATAVNQVVKMFSVCCRKKNRETRAIEDISDINHDDMGIDEWTFWKSVGEMKRWMDASKTRPLQLLFQLLSKTPPSLELHRVELKDQNYIEEGIEVSVLSMVLLIRIAVISIPSSLTGILVPMFNEVYEIIIFINDRTNFVSLKNKKKSKLAKLIWSGRDFHILLPIIFERSSIGRTETQSDIDRAILIIRELKNALPSDVVWDEIAAITDFIRRRRYSSVKDLYEYMEKLLVDMLHLFLSQFPIAIYNEVMESPPEEYEERVRHCLQLLWKIEPFDGIVQWSFPVGSNISSLIVPQVSSKVSETETYEECNTFVTNDDGDVIIHIT